MLPAQTTHEPLNRRLMIVKMGGEVQTHMVTEYIRQKQSLYNSNEPESQSMIHPVVTVFFYSEMLLTY